jgi:hypothetical protein
MIVHVRFTYVPPERPNVLRLTLQGALSGPYQPIQRFVAHCQVETLVRQNAVGLSGAAVLP